MNNKDLNYFELVELAKRLDFKKLTELMSIWLECNENLTVEEALSLNGKVIDFIVRSQDSKIRHFKEVASLSETLAVHFSIGKRGYKNAIEIIKKLGNSASINWGDFIKKHDKS